jgi:PAS domain S-box-containing protein
VALRGFSRWAPGFGGVVVGGGIAAMHYTGMSALDLPGHVTWSTPLVGLSIALGAALAALAVSMAARRDDWAGTATAAIVLTLAIVSHHFIAMTAVSVIPDPTVVATGLSLSPSALSAAVAGVAVFILGLCLVAAISDRRSQDIVGKQKALLDMALQAMSHGLCVFDAEARILICNERYTSIAGLPAASLSGKSLRELLHYRKEIGDFRGDPDELFERRMSDIRNGKTTEHILETNSGRSLRVIDQPMNGGGFVATLEDITQWKRPQAQIAHMAGHDALTDLPNRTLFTDIKSGFVTGFEALVRWNHPIRGLIPPMDFIPQAEETGLIIPIGDWVLAQACKEAVTWPVGTRVAVNLSAVQFKNRQLTATVLAALAESGLPPDQLELEITEAVLLRDSETTLATLHKLREHGIRISMDDFGTGYSSLSYLRSFPFDKIKIDKSFVQELAHRSESMAIVRAVTGLGKSLGIPTTAEGVETAEQLAILRSEGCTEIQGYLVSPPRPSTAVADILRKDQEQYAAVA